MPIYVIRLTKRCIHDCSHVGKCDVDVCYWLKDTRVKNQIDKIPPADIAAYLKTLGAWDTDELTDIDANRERLLWDLANQCRDNLYNNGLKHKDPAYWEYRQSPCTAYFDC